MSEQSSSSEENNGDEKLQNQELVDIGFDDSDASDAKKKEQGKDTKPPQSQAYSLSSFRVLIVEDYPFMAELMTTMMREMGIGHIMMAENSIDAEKMILSFNTDPGSRKHIDLIITDWLMPVGSGPELLSFIRGHKKDSVRFLPVIVCSAYTSEDVVKEGRDYGANEVLVKPISAESLAKRILHVIDQPRPFIKSPEFFGPDRRR